MVGFGIVFGAHIQTIDPVQADGRVVDEGDPPLGVGDDDALGQLAQNGVPFGRRRDEIGGGFPDVGHVEGDADEAEHFVVCAQAGPGKGLQPAVFTVVTQVAGFHGEGLARGFAVEGFLQHALVVIRMDDRAPVGQTRLFIGPAVVGDVGLVDEGAGAVLLGHPDQHRGRVGDGAETLLALAHLGLGAGAFDLGPGAQGDLLQQGGLRFGPMADGGVVGVEEGAQAAGPDHRRAHEGAGFQSFEHIQRVAGPLVLLHVGDMDQTALGQIGDQVGAEIGQAEIALGADDAGRPVAGHGYQAAFLIDDAIADAVGAQFDAQSALNLENNIIGRRQVAEAIHKGQQEGLPPFLPFESGEGFAGLGGVERHADITEEDAVSGETRIDRYPHPAPGAVRATEPRLESIGQAVGPGRGHCGFDAGLVVRMDGRLPDIAQNALRGLAVEFDEGRVDELDLAVRVGHPDRGGGRIGHQAEPGLALTQGRLGRAGLGHIDVDADHPAIGAVRFDPRMGVGVKHPPLTVMPEVPAFDFKRGLTLTSVDRRRHHSFHVVRMDRGDEVQTVQRLRGRPEFALGGVEMHAFSRRIGHPQHDGRVLADQAQLMFTIVDAGP